MNIPKQIEDTGFMASRFVAIFLLGRQSELALPAEAEKKKEAKDTKAETGIFSLFGYKVFWIALLLSIRGSVVLASGLDLPLLEESDPAQARLQHLPPCLKKEMVFSAGTDGYENFILCRIEDRIVRQSIPLKKHVTFMEMYKNRLLLGYQADHLLEQRDWKGDLLNQVTVFDPWQVVVYKKGFLVNSHGTTIEKISRRFQKGKSLAIGSSITQIGVYKDTLFLLDRSHPHILAVDLMTNTQQEISFPLINPYNFTIAEAGQMAVWDLKKSAVFLFDPLKNEFLQEFKYIRCVERMMFYNDDLFIGYYQLDTLYGGGVESIQGRDRSIWKKGGKFDRVSSTGTVYLHAFHSKKLMIMESPLKAQEIDLTYYPQLVTAIEKKGADLSYMQEALKTACTISRFFSDVGIVCNFL